MCVLWTGDYSPSTVVREDSLLDVEWDVVLGQAWEGFGFVADGAEEGRCGNVDV